MALEPTKGQEQISKSVNGGDEKQPRLNFWKSIASGANLGDIHEASLTSGLLPEMPSFEEFQADTKDSMSEEEQQPYYDKATKLFDLYRAIDKQNLQVSGYRFPDTEYFKSDEYAKDEITKAYGTDKVVKKDRYFTLPNGKQIEMFSRDQEASAKGFYSDKNGEFRPLGIADYADNRLMIQETLDGDAFWQEAQDNEFIAPELIRDYWGRDRTLDTKSAWNSMIRGLWSGSAPIITKGIGTGVGVVGNLTDQLFSNVFDYEFRPEERGYYKFNASAQNWGNAMSTKNFDEMNSMFDDWNASVHTISNGITQLLGIIGTGFILGAGAQGLTRILGTGKWAQQFAFQGSLLIGDFEAASGVQDILIQEGVDFNRSSRYLVPYMIATHVSEMTFGGIVERAGGNMAARYLGKARFSTAEIAGVVNKEIGIAAAATGKALRNMSVKEQKTVVGKIWKKLLNLREAGIERQTKAAVSDKALSRFASGLGRTTYASFTESLEELEEAAMHRWLNMFVNGREAMIGERYNNIHNNYDYTPIDTKTLEAGYKRISKTNSKDITELSYGEYQDHVRNTNHFNDVLGGRKTLSTDYSIEEGVAAFISTFITFGVGNGTGIMSTPKKKEITKYTIASAALKDPKVLSELKTTLDDMIKGGAFQGLDKAEEMTATFIEDIRVSMDMLSLIKDDPIIFNAVQGKEALIKQAYMANQERLKHQAKLTALNNVIGSLENGPLKEDNIELGLKAGTTKEEVDILIKQETKLAELADEKYRHVTEPEKATELSFENLDDVQRKKLDKAIFYGKPPKEKITSKAYSEMIFNALSLDHIVKSKIEEQVRKSLNLKPNQVSKKFTEEVEKLLPYGYAAYNLPFGNVLAKFEGTRDQFLVALKNLSERTDILSKSKVEKIQKQFTGLTEEGTIEGGVSTAIANITKPITDLFKGLKKGESVYDDPKKILDLKGTLETTSQIMKSLTGLASTLDSTTEQGRNTKEAFNALRSIPGMLSEGFNEEAEKQGMDQYLSAFDSNLSGLTEAFDKPLDKRDIYTDPNSEEQITALKDLIFEEFNKVNLIYQTADKEALGLGMSHQEIKDIITDYQKILSSLDNYILLNVDFIQGNLENNNDTSQHSPLLDNDNARLNNKLQEEWKNFVEEENKKINVINEKIQELTSDKITNNFKSEVSHLNLDFQLFNSILLFYKLKGYNGDKKIVDIIDLAIGKIQALFDKELTNGKIATDFNTLLSQYLTSDEKGRLELAEILHQIENEILVLKENLSQKVGPLILWLNSKAGDIYSTEDPLDNYLLFDRSAEQLLENEGLMSTKMWASGFNAFFKTGTLPLDEAAKKKFFFQHMINTLNEINQFGTKGIPTIKDVFKVIRDIVRETEIGKNINTYEQEKMLLSIVSFLFSPSNDFLREGISNEKMRVEHLNSVGKIINSVLFAKGYGGSGKTWLMSNVIKAYNKLTNNKLSVSVVIPSSDLQIIHEENLAGLEDIVDVNYYLLHDIISGKVKISDQSFVIVDEGTVLPVGQMDNMKKIVDESNSSWIFLGDDVQTTPFQDKFGEESDKAGEMFDVAGERYLLSNIARFTLPLTEVFRANLLQFSILQEKVRTAKFKVDPKVAIDSFLDFPSEFKIKQDGKGKLGIEYFQNELPDPEKNTLIDEFLSYVKGDKALDKGGKNTILVFLTNEDLEAALKEKSELENYQLKTIEYDLYSILEGNEDRANRLVSGLQVDNVFVAIDFRTNPRLKKVSTKLLIRSFLVSTTRQKKYLALVGDPNLSKDIGQEEADSKIHSFKNTAEEFSVIQKEYLIGDDEEGTGGRYSYLVDDGDGFNVNGKVPDTSEQTDRTLRLDPIGNKNNPSAYDTVKKETAKKVGKLKKNKARGIRLSDLFFNIDGQKIDHARLSEKELIAVMNNETLESSERDSAASILESKKLHGLFNFGINYTITKIQNPTSKNLDLIQKDIFAIYDFMNEHFAYGYKNYESLLSKLVKTITLQPDITLQINEDLAIAAPYVTSKIGNTVYSTQPNLLTVVGYTTVNNETIPIIDVHLYKYRHIKGIFESDLTHIGGQLTLLANEGFKINNVIVHNFTLDFKESPSKMEQVQRIQLTSTQIVDALNEANKHLKIEGTFAQNDKQNTFIFDESIIATDQEFGKESRQLPEHKGITAGMTFVKDGRKNTIKLLTTQLVNGKREIFVHIGKKKIPFTEFYSSYIKSEGKLNPTYFNSTSAKYASDLKALWGTTMAFILNDDILKLIPKHKFFEVTGKTKNDFLELKQTILKNLSSKIAFKFVIHKDGIEGIGVNSYGDNEVTTHKQLWNEDEFKHPITIEFANDKFIKIVLKNKEVKDTMVSLAKKYDISFTSEVELFKLLGMDKLGFMGEVEYQFGRGEETKFNDAVLIEKANNYINSENLTDEKAKELLDEIFKNAFIGNEKGVEDLDEVAANSRADLIIMNKARMELRRELYNTSDDKVIRIAEIGNGRPILETKSTPVGKVPNKIFTVQEVIDNSNLYGFNIETKDGKLVLNWEKKDKRTRIYAKAWRINNAKLEPVFIYFDGRETTKTDYDEFIKELESLKSSNELKEAIDKLEDFDIKTSEFNTAFIGAAKMIESAKFFAFLNTNKNTVIELAEYNQPISSRIMEKRGSLQISTRSLIGRLNKAIALARYFKENHGKFVIASTNQTAAFYQPVFLPTEKDGIREIDIANIRTAFKTLSQPDLWIRYEPSISLDKAATASNMTELIPTEQAMSELEKILGKHAHSNVFLNQGLFTREDTTLVGRLEEQMMILAEIDGMIQKTAHKHEALHFILIHLVDPAKVDELLIAAENELKAKNIQIKKSKTERLVQLHEYLAEQYELRSDIPNTILDKFINWLRFVIAKITGNKINQFFTKVDRGVYVNQSIQYSNLGIPLNKVNNIYNSEEANDALLSTFGNINAVNELRSTKIANKWFAFSPYGMNFSITKTNWKSTLEKITEALRNEAFEIAKEIVTIHSDDGTVSDPIMVKDMTAGQYLTALTQQRVPGSNANDNIRAVDLYEVYQLGDEYIAKSLYQKLFIDIDIELLEQDINNDTSIKRQTIFNTANELRNPLASESSYFQFLIGSLPLYNYSAKGTPIFPNKYVNFTQIDVILTQTYLHLKSEGKTPSFNNVLDFMDKMINTKGVNYIPNPIIRNNVYSFLRYFGTIEDPQRPIPVMENGILKGIGLSSLLEDPEFVEDIVDVSDDVFNDKIDKLIEFIKLIHKHYDSLRHNIISYIDFQKPQSEISVLHGITQRSIKSGLNDTSNLAMLSAEGDIREDIEKGFEQLYEVNLGGIKSLDVNTPGMLIELSNLERTTIDDALSMFKFLGFNAVTPEILAHLQRNDNWANIVDELYGLMQIAYTAVLISNDIKRTEEKKIYNQGVWWTDDTLSNIKILNSRYNKDYTTGDLVNTEEIDKFYNDEIINEVYKLYPLPSDNWKFIENVLAKAISYDISNVVSRMHRKATGTMSYAYPLSSYLFDLFPQMEGSSNVFSGKIKQDLSVAEDTKGHTLLNDKDIDSGVIAKYNDPILNNRIVFDFIQLFDGIKVINNATDYDKLTEFDLIKSIIEGYYVNQLTKKGTLTKIPTFSDTLSSKTTMPVFNWLATRKNEPSFILKANGGNLPNKMFNLIMDKKVLIDMVYDLARYYEKLAKTDRIQYKLTVKNNPYIASLASIRKDFANSDLLYQKIQKVFLTRFNEFLDVLDEHNYTLPENISNDLNGKEWFEDPLAEENVFERKNYIKKDGSWHPLLEVVFWSHAMFNESLSHLVRGPQAMYGKSESNSVIDYIKRAGIVAPGYKYSLDKETSTLPQDSRVIVMNDPIVANKMMDGEVEALDGVSWIFPWYHEGLKREAGGELNTLGNGAIKNVNFNYNPISLDLHYLKFAQFPITPKQFESSEYLQQMNTMALGEVGDMVYEGTTWNDRFLADYKNTRGLFFKWIINEGKEHRNKLVDYVVYNSAFKVGERKVHGTKGDFNEIVINNPSISKALNKDDNVMFISNKTLRHQTVTQQSVEDQFAPIPTQLLFIIGGLSHNNNTIQNTNTALAKIINQANDELIENAGNENYLHEIGGNFARVRGKMNKFGALISDPNIDINIFRDNLFTALITEMKQYTTPELPGLSFIQAPSMANLLWKNGIAYYPSEIKDPTGYTRRPLKPISYDKNNKFSPAEVIGYFHNATKFGITTDMTLAESMTIYNGTNSVMMNTGNEFDIIKREELIRSKFKDIDINIAFDSLSDSQRSVIGEETIENLVKYFLAFNQSLDIISVRIPTSNASTAFIGRIVAFDFDADNTLFVSSEKNIIDGSDYDIDALRVFFRNISNDFNLAEDDTAENQNQMFQGIVEYYNEPKNKLMIIQAITYENIKKEAAKKMKDRNLYSSDIGSTIKAFGYSMAGKDLAGHFPNLENFLFRLWALTNTKRNKVLHENYKDQFNDENIIQISKQVASLINAAVDNENLGGALGILNINTVSSPLISGMIFSGLSEDEIIKALDNEEVVSAIKQAKESTNLTSTQNTYGNTNQVSRIELYQILSDPKLLEYAYIGEALKRLSNIIGLQRKLPTTIYEFNAKINQIEFTLGMSLPAYLGGNNANVNEQLEFIDKEPGKKRSHDHETRIREILNVQELFNSYEMIHFKYLLGVVSNINTVTNQFTVQGNVQLQNQFFRKTGISGFSYANQYQDFSKAIDNQLVGLFVSSEFGNLEMNNQIFDLSKLSDRFEFVSRLPNFVKSLKESTDILVKGNSFIQGLRIEKAFGNSNTSVVQFRNSNYLNQNDYLAYQRAFKHLDLKLQNVFNAYQLLINGFIYRNGSLIEVLSEKNERNYSRWFQSFQRKFNDEEFLESFIDRLIRVDKRLAPVISKTREGNFNFKPNQEYANYEKNRAKEPILLKNTGDSKLPKYVNAVGNSLFNSYTEDNHETNYTVFNNITQDQIDLLNQGKDINVKLFKTSIKVGEIIDPSFDQFSNNIYNGQIVKIPTGQLIQIIKTGRFTAILSMNTGINQSKIKKEETAVSYKFIEPFVKMIQKSFPNIKINLVDNERMGDDNTIAWIEKGEVFINTDRIQLDTPIHEFVGHILVDLIESTNPALFGSLYAEALALLNSTSGRLIKEHYSHLSQTDLIREVIANMMGWASEEKVLSFLMKAKTEKAIPNSKSLFGRIKNLLNPIRNIIMSWINRTFGTRLNLKNIETASISDIAKSVVTAIEKGDVISYVSSRQFSKLQRMAKYESRINKDVVKGIGSLYEMLNDKIKIREERADELEASIRLGDSNVFKDQIFGEIKQVNPNNRDEVLAAIDAQDEFAGTFTNTVINWLNDGGNLVQKAIVFGENESGNPLFKDMENFIHQVEYDLATHYMKYSDLKNHPTFGHLYDSGFVTKDYDPIIAITAATEDMINISIFDITPIPVGYNATKDNILIDLIPNNVKAKLKGINLTNDETGIRQLMSGLLLNQMMEADSKVSVENVKFIELKRSKSQDHTIDPIAMTNTIRTLGQEKEFMNSIANKKIKSIFKDPKHTAKIDYLKTLKSFYQDIPPENTWNYGLRAVLENENLTPRERYTILANRQKVLQAGLDERNVADFTPHQVKELKYLVGAIFQVRKSLSHDSQINPFVGLTKFDKMVFNSSSVGDENVQALKRIIFESSGRIVELMNREKTITNQYYKDAKAIYDGSTSMAKLRSISQDVWDALFVKMKDKNGVEFNTGYIYWTKNENEVKSEMQKKMARQARDLNIDDKLLDIGRKITEKVEEYVKRSMLNNKLNGSSANSFWNYKKKRVYKLEDIDLSETMYERGQMPILTRTPGEQFAAGTWEEMFGAVRKKFKVVGDVYEFFDHSLGGAEGIHTDFNKLNDLFSFQWGGTGKNQNTSSRTPLGYSGRVGGLMGIKKTTVKVGGKAQFELELVDIKKNNDISKNVNLVMESFMMSVLRTEEYENHVLPTINSLKIYLQDMANHSNDPVMQNKLIQTIDYLNLYTKQGIKGERQKWKEGKIAGIDFDALLMGSMTVARPVVMTLNFNIGMIGLVTNAMFAFMEGISNQFVERGFFNASELAQASTLFFSDPGKTFELVRMYQVMNKSEEDVLRHQTQRIELENIFTEFWSNSINYGADYYARGVVMIAQMLHDGSWDAHVFDGPDGTISYDQTKDKRFTTGEKGAQEAMTSFVRGELIKDGIWGQKEGELLVRGYHLEWGRKFKALADKYVTGAYDAKAKSLLGSHILGKMLGFLHTWFEARYTNAFQRESVAIEELSDYRPVKDINGHWTAEQQRLNIEGYITSVMTLGKHLFAGNLNDYKINPTRKANFIKFGLSWAGYLAIRALYLIFVQQGKDDKRKLAVIPDWRIVRNVRYGVASLLVVPTLVEILMHPFAAIDIITGWFTDPMGKLVVGNIPMKTQFKTIAEPVKALMEELELLDDGEVNRQTSNE